MKVPLFLLMIASSAPAADLQVWNITEIGVFKSGPVSVDAFAGVRIRDHLGEAYDKRFGGVVKIAVTPRLTLSGGYLRRWVDTRKENRFYGGATIALLRRPLRVDSITLVERFQTTPVDYTRVRPRIDVELPRKTFSPVVSEEATIRSQGIVRWRTFGGVRCRFDSGWRLEAGYQFDTSRVAGAWVPTHVLRTNVRIGHVLWSRK